MDRVKHLVITVAVIISLFLIFSQTAYASIDVDTFDQAAYAYYIDPGTGSIIIQILIGSVVGGLAMIGVYRVRVKNFLRNLFKKRRSHGESE
jgi:hypothetical protein